MNGPSKILTVSYGTFACTLEGFDDPMTTMRIVAEYFRDLAADDRDFGSEPPMPDAEILQRIAERELKRRVDTKVEANGVVHLRASDVGDAVASLLRGVEIPQTPGTIPAYTAEAAQKLEGVAAKLMRIRASSQPPIEGRDNRPAGLEAPDEASGMTLDDAFPDPSDKDFTVAGLTATLIDREDAEPEADLPRVSKWSEAASSAALPDGIDDWQLDAQAAFLSETAQAEDGLSAFGPPVETDEPLAATDPADALPVAAPEPEAHPTTLLKQKNARARLIKIRRSTDRLEPDLEALAPDPPAPKAQKAGRALYSADTSDTSVRRLIAQTNSEMEVPEHQARWSAIAHLKVAVATTVADREDGTDNPAAATDESHPYKDVLSRLVSDTSPNPASDRPPPLILVSELRIDRRPAAPADAGFVGVVARPRRVGPGGNLAVNPLPFVVESAEQDFLLGRADDHEDANSGEVSIFFDPSDFSDFARQLGAETLSDVIQAAGVYASMIECRPHFSPTHLIRQIASAPGLISFDREDGLRAFGELLRDGKIERVRQGHYVVTEDSTFMQQAMRVMG